ncbi:MAG: prephenate dehydrogenase/arogenate dehydrogenase family protein [Ruegeria sp.]
MQSRPLIRSVGLIGCGAFGRLIARHLTPLTPLVVHDPRPIPADMAGVTFGTLPQAATCDLVILAVPVAQLEPVLTNLAPHLRPGAVVADVSSVKVTPVQLMERLLPAYVSIVGTHPLFGPQSASDGIAGRKIAVCRVRGDACLTLAALCRKLLGLHPHLVSPEDHDREAAVVQGLTHFIAQIVARIDPLPDRLTTVSFDKLREAIDMVRHDPPGVFQAIERSNPFAAPVRDRFLSEALELAGDLDRPIALREIPEAPDAA